MGIALDPDNDGVLDIADADGDGISDVIDASPGVFGSASAIPTQDTDGDGTPDSIDLTSDPDDGALFDIIIFYPDEVYDLNGNGRADPADTDGDGISNDIDTLPLMFGGIRNPFPDSDGDGIPDRTDADADNGGVPDVVESGGVDENGDGRIDNFEDLDGDGLDDNSAITNPVDTDSDGVPDYVDSDADNDGIPDVVENGLPEDPNNPGQVDNFVDENGDGRADGVPTPDTDSDNDGINNALDTDADNDGLPDGYENGFEVDEDGRLVDFIDENGNGYHDPIENSPANVQDTDQDTIPDYLDRDSDGDTIPDLVEAGGDDTNGDGRVDDITDSDGDGIADMVEGGLPRPDTDGDGVPDHIDLDSDNDGIPDAVEQGKTDSSRNGRADNPALDVTLVDSDGDGVPDYLDLDSDNDGIPDVLENSAHPSEAGDDGMVLDTLPLSQGWVTGYRGLKTDRDTDGDGISDFRDLDSDNDGLPDLLEGGGVDSDSDGMVDSTNDPNGNGWAETVENSPLPLPDTDGDSRPDYLDLDSDNDSIPDVVEAGLDDTNGDALVDSTVDNNNNGFADIYEDARAGSTFTLVDTDGDGLPDLQDLDSDNDAVSDLVEGGLVSRTVVDFDNDGVMSGSDADRDGIVDVGDADPANFGTVGNPSVVSTNRINPISVPGVTDMQRLRSELNDMGLDLDRDGVLDDSTDGDIDGIADVVDAKPNAFGGLGLSVRLSPSPVPQVPNPAPGPGPVPTSSATSSPVPVPPTSTRTPGTTPTRAPGTTATATATRVAAPSASPTPNPSGNAAVSRTPNPSNNPGAPAGPAPGPIFVPVPAAPLPSRTPAPPVTDGLDSAEIEVILNCASSQCTNDDIDRFMDQMDDFLGDPDRIAFVSLNGNDLRLLICGTSRIPSLLEALSMQEFSPRYDTFEGSRVAYVEYGITCGHYVQSQNMDFGDYSGATGLVPVLTTLLSVVTFFILF